MRKPNSDLKRKIYECVLKRIQEGSSPTVREICNELGINSTSTAQRYLTELVKDGVISHAVGKSRSYVIPDTAFKAVPIMGKIRAGAPILAVEEIEGYVNCKTTTDINNLFALRVVGDSMKDAGILEGDVIIARSTPTAENGDIVVALLDDEATVKVFYRDGDKIRLQPRNDDYEPIITDSVSILGRVISLSRDY